MDLLHRAAGSRSVFIRWAAVIAFTCCGCADMMPDSETWEKWSPSNLWYRMSPNQLSRLNEGSGLPSDVYYSISDYPERDSAPVTAKGTSSDAVVVKPIDTAAGAAQP
jgi:hypothetical protein